MDIVLPLSVKYRSGERSDLLRLKVLLSSVKKFWRGGGTLHIVTPDVDAVRAEINRLNVPEVRVEIHSDESVFDRLPSGLNPWWKQQIIKLASHAIVTSDFYLVLDADCFFVRETTENDLVPEGRGRVSYGTGSAYSHAVWYRGCRRLGLTAPERFVNTTPFVMHRRLAAEALAFVQETPGSIGKLGWSEYTLYHSLAAQNALWDVYHVEGKPILGNAVWEQKELATWDAKATHEGFLSLVQSNTHVSAAWVEERLSTE